jgi:hypothetical protein
MTGTCGLAPDINKCPNYNANTENCTANNNVCGFFREPGKKERKKEEKTEYKREFRWYEQYYNG